MHTPETPGGDPALRGNEPRRTLPSRDVSPSTLEDAYVRFMFYCNPGLLPTVDTKSLRDTFRTPPKSGGKVFDTFTVYELVRKFYAKEIKTWTEVTTRLGVEPPDLANDESAQKLAQYGVRLKKWLNSMHIKAFFEYLMDIPNDYWTRIPTNPDLLATAVRDGVALEDDMALRALIPAIRPRRGRKRPERERGLDADVPTSAAQRPRLDSPGSAVEGYGYRNGAPDGPWSAHPDASGVDSDKLPDLARANGPGDSLQTPIGRWPQSAVTPSARGSFWDDALEPQSATTPKARRRGYKNVSSAWRTAGHAAEGRSRGRPPMNRPPVDTPGEYAQNWRPTQQDRASSGSLHSYTPSLSPQLANDAHTSSQHAQFGYRGHDYSPGLHGTQHAATNDSLRHPRPNISLQVPDRPGGSVRLATPPATGPDKEIKREHAPPDQMDQMEPEAQSTDRGYHRAGDNGNGWRRFAKEATDAYEQGAGPGSGVKDPQCGDTGTDLPDFYFEKMVDRTNVDTLVAYFVQSMQESEWRDTDGKIIDSVNADGANAMVHAMLQTMYKTATSPQAFLINLAALAGSTTLVTSRPKCTRLGEDEHEFTYKCEWEYRFGEVKGGFTFEQKVPQSMWSRFKKGGSPTEAPDEGSQCAEHWQNKYMALIAEMKKRDKEIQDLKIRMMKAMDRDFDED